MIFFFFRLGLRYEKLQEIQWLLRLCFDWQKSKLNPSFAEWAYGSVDHGPSVSFPRLERTRRWWGARWGIT